MPLFQRAHPGTRKRIREAELVNVDIAVWADGCHSDQARTYAVGRAWRRAADMHEGLRRIADDVIAMLRPGVSAGQVFECGAPPARASSSSEVLTTEPAQR